jgi:glycosyltransferase involved in cell wall biosynthesis
MVSESYKFSVITPTLNCRATLPQTLEALRPLREAGAEHIVVDSGSTDGTVALAVAAGATVLSYPKGNMYAAINHGMSASSGRWLTYINGDDILYSDSALVAVSEAEPDCSVVYGDLDYIDEAGRFLFGWRTPRPWALGRGFRAYSPIAQPGTWFRREVYLELAGFSTRYKFSADYDFFSRAHASRHIFKKYCDRSLAAFRLSPGQLSQARRAEMAPEGIAIRAALGSKSNRVARKFNSAFMALYRISTNLDNRALRRLRSRGLDNR